MPMLKRYGYVQFYPMDQVDNLGWDWHREHFLNEARRAAEDKGYHPPPGDPVLDLSYWSWSDTGMEQVNLRQNPRTVRVLWCWEGPGDG